MTTFPISHLIKQLRQLGSGVPKLASPFPLSQPKFGTGVDEQELVAFEAKLGIHELPADLREFYLNYAPVQAMDVFNGYHIYDLKRVPRVSKLTKLVAKKGV